MDINSARCAWIRTGKSFLGSNLWKQTTLMQQLRNAMRRDGVDHRGDELMTN
jgi:hypothetical protein